MFWKNRSLAALLCFGLSGCAGEPPPRLPLETIYAWPTSPIWLEARDDKGNLDVTWNCGQNQMQTVLRAYGYEVPINKLYAWKWEADGGHSLPWDISGYLWSIGRIPTHTYFEFDDATFMLIAQHALTYHHPLIVQIWATRGHHGMHWVSIWGYDARKNVFMVYDSQYADRTGGVGNTEYSPQFLMAHFYWWLRVAIEVGK